MCMCAAGLHMNELPDLRYLDDPPTGLVWERPDRATVAVPAVGAEREPWDRDEARRLTIAADKLPSALGVSGRHPEIATGAAMVASAYATHDMETVRFTVAEFEATVRRCSLKIRPRPEYPRAGREQGAPK